MTGPLVLVERDGTCEVVDMVRPDPPESDTIVKTVVRGDTARRIVYGYVGVDGAGYPIYKVTR